MARKIKAGFSFLIFLFITVNTPAQVRISGFVRDEKNKGIPYANVFISGTYEGVVTNDTGYYELVTRIKGTINIGASCIGYETSLKSVETEIFDKPLLFQLKEAYTSLSPVVITAGTFAASDQNKTELLRPRDIGTTAGTPGDIQATIEALPATQNVGYTEGLFVRGGSGKESKYIMDGMVFPNPYYPHVPSIKQRGRLDPFLFSGMIFSAGGYSAQYGQALSSVMVLNSKGIADSTVSGGGLHLYGPNVFHTRRWEHSSLYTNFSFNNFALYHQMMKQNVDWAKSPVNKELRMVYRNRINCNGLLKVYTSVSGTEMGINLKNNTDTISNYNNRNLNFIVNCTYSQYFNKNKTSVTSGFSSCYNKDEINLFGKGLMETESLNQFKIVLKHNIADNVDLLAGWEYGNKKLSGEAGILRSTVRDELSSLFAETEMTINNKFAARLGMRFENSSYAGQQTIVPRTSIAYKFSRSGQLSFSYGIFYQLPDNEMMLSASSKLKNEKAEHFIFNYQYQLNDRTLRFETFYKLYGRLVTEYQAQQNLSGYSGYAQGIEFFFRDKTTIPNLDYWISYSFTDSKRKTILPDELITPQYLSRHSLAFVTKYWIPFIGVVFSTSCHFATERKFCYINNNGISNTLRIPAFITVDISISKPFVMFHQQAMFFCSLQNLNGPDNVLGYAAVPTFQEPLGIYRTETHSFFAGIFINMYN